MLYNNMGCGSIKKHKSSQDLEPKSTNVEDREDGETEAVKEITIPNCSIKTAVHHLDVIPAVFPNKSLFTVKEEQSYLEESGHTNGDMHQRGRLISRRIRLPSLQ
jgi:hypothetical protein